MPPDEQRERVRQVLSKLASARAQSGPDRAATAVRLAEQALGDAREVAWALGPHDPRTAQYRKQLTARLF